MCQNCVVKKSGTIVFGYDLGTQETLSKDGKYGAKGSACDCPCSPWMKEPFLQNVDAIYGRRRIQWRRAATTSMGCHNCHHEVAFKSTPWQEDQLKRLKKKIRNATLLMCAGIAMVFGALALLAWGGLQGGAPNNRWLLFAILMILGTAIAFGGLDALIFGYKNFEEQLEEMGMGQQG